MKRVLSIVTPELYYNKNGEKITGKHELISGDVTGISGDVTGISGDVTGISGNVSNANITVKERENGIDIKDLIKN